MTTSYAPASGEQAEVLMRLVSSLTPLLVKMADSISEDLQYDGWRWLFLIIEKYLGTEKFRLLASNQIQEPKCRKVRGIRAGLKRLLRRMLVLREEEGLQ